MLRSCLCLGFFFQAEDGIRDLVRSRGLGDVYKRQQLEWSGRHSGQRFILAAMVADLDSRVSRSNGPTSVSYTHLTLPTSDLV